MSDMINWDAVESVPTTAGAFIGWGTTPGQHVTGKIVEYSPLGGTDFNGDPCPQLAVELVDKSASFNKSGDRTDYAAGDLVNLTVGQAALRSAIKRADPTVGDLIKITLTGTEKTNRGNTVKVFDVKIARSASAPVGDSDAAPATQEAVAPF